MALPFSSVTVFHKQWAWLTYSKSGYFSSSKCVVGLQSCMSVLTEVADCFEGDVKEWPKWTLGCSSGSRVLL